MFKQTVIGLTCFLAGLITAVGITSQAQTRLEIGTGFTKFSAREDGIWWQSQYPHKLDLFSGAFQVGVHQNLSPAEAKYKIGVRGAFVHFGSFRSDAMAMPDENIGAAPSTCEANGTNCLGHFQGYGQAYGLSLGPTLERSWGRFTVQGGLGALFYKSWFDLTLQPVGQCEVMGPQVCEKQHQSSTGYHFTPYVEAQIRWAFTPKIEAFASVRSYRRIIEQGDLAAGGNVGLTGGETQQLMVGLSVPM